MKQASVAAAALGADLRAAERLTLKLRDVDGGGIATLHRLPLLHVDLGEALDHRRAARDQIAKVSRCLALRVAKIEKQRPNRHEVSTPPDRRSSRRNHRADLDVRGLRLEQLLALHACEHNGQ
jgi:hypothetical protein